jgi:hypothetical protein
VANPLKLRTHANGQYIDGVQVTTDAELQYLAKLLLIEYATESGSGDNTGDLNIDSSGTSVGTFVDQFATGELGSHPYAGSTSSTTYTFKQNTAAASESSIIPLVTIDSTTNPGHIRVVTDAELNAVIDIALDDIAKANSSAAGTGTYYVSTAAPSITGSWIAQDQFYDEVTNNANDDDEKTTYKLWRKVSFDSTPATLHLLKQTGTNIRVQSETELKHLTTRLRNRIIATGKGTYKFQATAPGTGTWVQRGSAVDRNPNISSIQYTGTYSAQYEGNFGRSFTREFSADYTRGQYARLYQQQFTRQYTGDYFVNFAREFQRQFSRGVVGGQYTGPKYNGPTYQTIRPGPQYAGTQYTRQFFAQYGRTYSAQYGRTYSSQFQRVYSRGNQYAATFSTNYSPGVSYAVTYATVYYGNYSRGTFGRSRPGPNYVGTRAGPQYQGTYNRAFNRNFFRQFAREYTRQYQRQYTRQFQRQYSRGFQREFPELGYSGPAYGPGGLQPVNEFDPGSNEDGTVFYRGLFLRGSGPLPGLVYGGSLYAGPQYNGPGYNGPLYGGTRYAGTQYQGPTFAVSYQSSYTTQFQRTYGPAQYGRIYYGNYVGNYGRTRVGPYYTRTFYARQFLRARLGPQYTRTFAGPQYTGNFVRANYARSRPGPQYAGHRTGPQYNEQYGRTYARANFQRQFTRQFTRQFVGQYAVGFARGDVFARTFSRLVIGPQFTGNFTRAQYAGQFSRTTIGPDFTSQYTNQFAGSRDKQYSGATVTTSYTTSTKTLWLRVA